MTPPRQWGEWLLSSHWAPESGTGPSALLSSAPTAVVTLGGVHKFCSIGLNGCGQRTERESQTNSPEVILLPVTPSRLEAGASLNNLLGGFSGIQRLPASSQD